MDQQQQHHPGAKRSRNSGPILDLTQNLHYTQVTCLYTKAGQALFCTAFWKNKKMKKTEGLWKRETENKRGDVRVTHFEEGHESEAEAFVW